jgi:hypothetical protein
MDPSTVSKIKVHKLGITAYTKKKAPKYIKDQEKRAKTGLRKIYKKSLEKVLVIDDETYVTFDPSQLPGRKFFHALDQSEVEYEHKFKQMTKFPKKYLVWQAMDEFGNVSEPFIKEGSLTSPVYLEECIKKRLIPFIRQHHEQQNVLFWPDLATCHYANIVTSYLEEKGINIVTKESNPPNVPQARGIEMFWAACKRQYSSRPKEPKNLRGFKLIWNKISKDMAEKVGKECMAHASKLIRSIGYKGIRSAMTDISNKRKH